MFRKGTSDGVTSDEMRIYSQPEWTTRRSSLQPVRTTPATAGTLRSSLQARVGLKNG